MSLHRRKRPVDPWRPNGWLWEEERRLDGTRIPVLAVFLAGAECAFKCVFCDLWRGTLDGPTPLGAIPAQLKHALDAAGPVPAGAAVKLYNSSNFFEPRAVPPHDMPAIEALVEPFDWVIVESHPRIISQRCLDFASRLNGRLEVAIGLETAHPGVLARLNKAMTLDDFDSAATRLRAAGVGLRVFLLLPPPYLPSAETIDWIQRSVTHASNCGAIHISLIPTRGSLLDELRQHGEFTPPDLGMIEDVFDRCHTANSVVVNVDLWDIDEFITCPHCAPERVARLRTLNLTGRALTRVSCLRCESPS
jgi:hypothetical protein